MIEFANVKNRSRKTRKTKRTIVYKDWPGKPLGAVYPQLKTLLIPLPDDVFKIVKVTGYKRSRIALGSAKDTPIG